MTDSDQIKVSRSVPTDPMTTYAWFTEPSLLTTWWPSEAELDVRPGGEFRMYWAGPDVTLRGEYRVVLPGAQLDHTWSWDHDDLPPRLVSIGFAPDGAGTTIDIVHECGSEAEGADYRDGWEHFLGQLAERLDST